MAHDPWHYPRADFAETVLGVLNAGPATALTMFGPRRTGKTEFLLQDLGPLAESNGHKVIYISFWRAPLSPLAVLLHELEKGRKRGSFLTRTIGDKFQTKIKLSGAVPGVNLEGALDLSAVDGNPPTELLLYMDDLIGRLNRKKKPTLIFFDEIQEIARGKDQSALVAALRTSLDKHKGGIRAIFTGSSKEGLANLFYEKRSPFFHFATQVDLPILGEAFVKHLLKAFKASTGRTLKHEPVMKAFQSLYRNPYFFRGMLELMALNKSLDLNDALEKRRMQIGRELGYNDTWVSLSPLQRATVFVVASGNKPFAKNTISMISTLIAENSVTTSRIQAALRKLYREGIADNWDDEWVVQDPLFAEWVSKRKSDI